MSKQQQMQDILKDTVDYYREDPANRRSITDDGNCMYTWGNSHCAIGRYLRPEYQRETWEENNSSVNELTQHTDDGEWSIDWCLIDRVHGLNADFWRELQDMHDTMGYWEIWSMEVDGLREYKLTDEGKEYYVKMQDRIARGEYDG